VLIADPYSLFRQALRRCLDGQAGISVVAEARSPRDFRNARASVEYDVAIVASDLLSGTHSTAPLLADDYLLDEDEAAAGRGSGPPVIVLVADEDLRTSDMGPLPRPRPGSGGCGCERCYIPRSAPSEMLIDTIMALYHEAIEDESEL
jgi:hypothetical protein